MARDHYVSQVHLKRFYSQEGLLHAIRKSDLKQFTPRARDVCRIDEGNTNAYLIEPRAIEEFLKTIEGKYNAAVAALEAGKPEPESVYVLAGFLSYVLTCSPAAMRLCSEPPQGILEITAKLLEEMGEIPPPPSILGGESLSELLNSRKLKFQIDEKYPQAIGIANILQRVALFGNCRWEVLINRYDDCPFFTSDFPVACEPSEDVRVLNRIVPLTPSVAVRVKPDINIPRKYMGFKFSNFSFERRQVTRAEALGINRLLVQSAEDTVFFPDDQPWVRGFVEKHRHFRLETENVQVPHPRGALQVSRQSIVRFARDGH